MSALLVSQGPWEVSKGGCVQEALFNPHPQERMQTFLGSHHIYLAPLHSPSLHLLCPFLPRCDSYIRRTLFFTHTWLPTSLRWHLTQDTVRINILCLLPVSWGQAGSNTVAKKTISALLLCTSEQTCDITETSGFESGLWRKCPCCENRLFHLHTIFQLWLKYHNKEWMEFRRISRGGITSPAASWAEEQIQFLTS